MVREETHHNLLLFMTIRKHLVLMDLSAYSFQSSEPTFVMQPTTELVVAGYISKKIPELEGLLIESCKLKKKKHFQVRSAFMYFL